MAAYTVNVRGDLAADITRFYERHDKREQGHYLHRGNNDSGPMTATRPVTTATALWSSGQHTAALQSDPLASPEPGQVLVMALHSAISRGTESLVYAGGVPESVGDSMRAPFQQGNFAGPVKYGYLSVGVVTAVGDDHDRHLLARRVFCLYPHQDRYVVPREALTLVPDGVPSARAALAGVLEVAINVIWDTAPAFGDRIAVIGCGLVGASVAMVLSQFPLQRFTLVDPAPRSESLAQSLGASWATPGNLIGEFDIVIHCSGTQEGLALGLSALAYEGEIIEASWFGQNSPDVPLGHDFHAKRLSIRCSQVSSVAAGNRARRTRADRMALAMEQLHRPIYDDLITGRSPFDQLPHTLAEVSAGLRPGWLEVIDYPGYTECEATCSA